MRAVITLTVPGTSSAGRARFRPWRPCNASRHGTGGQPLQQTGLGRGQIHAGHADLGKSQLASPVLHVRNELTAADHNPEL
jgi:hypothetical protein